MYNFCDILIFATQFHINPYKVCVFGKNAGFDVISCIGCELCRSRIEAAFFSVCGFGCDFLIYGGKNI